MLSKTKKEQVKNYLQTLIYKHIDEINYKIPSENMLCRICKVSRITAKNAVEELVAEGLLFRHQGKGTFISSEAKAQILPREEVRASKFIGLLLPDLKSNFMLNLIQGIESKIHDTEYDLIIKCTNYSQTQEQKAVQNLQKSGAKGIIAYPVDKQFYNQEFLKLTLEKFPFALIDRTLPGLNVSVITSDNVNDMKKATESLILDGHRHIGLISTDSDGTNTIIARIQGYEEALGEHKIAVKGSYKLTSMINYDEGWEEKITEYFLENKKLTAVITLNSDLGYKTLRVLKKLNLRVPEDISLISYEDDYSGIADLMGVSLTSICQNPFEIGRQAAGIILNQAENINMNVRQIKIPSSFIRRESTRKI